MYERRREGMQHAIGVTEGAANGLARPLLWRLIKGPTTPFTVSPVNGPSEARRCSGATVVYPGSVWIRFNDAQSEREGDR